jgi:hypothetical protein
MLPGSLKAIFSSPYVASLPILGSVYFAFCATTFAPVPKSVEAYGFCRNPKTASYAAMCDELRANDPFTPSQGRHIGAAIALLFVSGIWQMGLFTFRMDMASSSDDAQVKTDAERKAA